MKSRVIVVCMLVVVFMLNVSIEVSSQSGVDIPFQFFGLPFIILLVRLAQFLKQLAYVFSPGKLISIVTKYYLKIIL